MIATELAGIVPPASSALVERESRLQRLVAIYIVTGVLFMLLPGTFLGVWNLLSISADHTVETIWPAWIQAHGHAQIFGWLGTFILGIGFYSLSKMGLTMTVARKPTVDAITTSIQGSRLGFSVGLALARCPDTVKKNVTNAAASRKAERGRVYRHS